MELFGVTVTQSNVTIALTIIGSFAIGLVALWWKVKTFWYDREQQFLKHVRETVAAQNALQTAVIENCIHKIPNHPENSTKVPDPPDSIPGD